MANTKLDSIWTPGFALLCSAQFLGYAPHHMLTPAFPLYVACLGGTPFAVGLVLASFAVTSVLFRPIIGYWADRWNEPGVLVSGLLFQAASILLCFVPMVEATMLANGFRGIGWAGFNTGGYSLLALSAPAKRRGEASGYYSAVQTSAMILFPAVALWLIDAPLGGFKAVFVVAAALSLIGGVIGAMLGCYVPRAAHGLISGNSGSSWSEIFSFVERDVLLPSALLFCVYLSLPAATSFVVLYAREVGIASLGSYFVVSGATSFLSRPLLGRASDRIGRAPSLAAGFALQIIALCLLVVISTLPGLLISGALYMMGSAIGSATTLALAVERAKPERRGRAMATFSVAFPLGSGAGALLAGSTVDLAGYSWMFLVVSGIVAWGLVITLVNWSSLN